VRRGENEGEGWLPERASAFICRCGLVLWCACVGDDWASWAAKRSGIVRRFYGLGWRCRWRKGWVGRWTVSVRLGLNLGSPGPVEVTWEQGEGGAGSGAGRRTRGCDARVGSVCVRTGDVAALWALWASSTRRNGTSRVACTVGFGLGWLGELTPGLGVMPAAK
jgi:hypothetical protein